ncbi:MAG: dihydroorotate dehydrogenase electron transfer subunit [Bacteroidetes bacterium]|nr:dihydroorotate dehydrogenase electron transfer subunit [Bacteroidota bacterium]
MKKIQDCTVHNIKNLNKDTYILELKCPEIPETIAAGNFAEVRVDRSADVFLRRPLSVYNVDYDKKLISFFIKIIGKGTALLQELKKDEIVNIIYPLGNSYDTKQSGKVLVIGGGSGIAPLLLLGKELKESGAKISYLLGGRTSEDIHLIEDFKKYGSVNFTTEDGSLGEKGRVTDHSIFNQISEFSKIYTCGPDPMMKAIGNIAQFHRIPCEVSLENMMACGFGVCLCCVTETKEGNKCVCTEGPVFNVDDLKW